MVVDCTATRSLDAEAQAHTCKDYYVYKKSREKVAPKLPQLPDTINICITFYSNRSSIFHVKHFLALEKRSESNEIPGHNGEFSELPKKDKVYFLRNCVVKFLLFILVWCDMLGSNIFVYSCVQNVKIKQFKLKSEKMK